MEMILLATWALFWLLSTFLTIVALIVSLILKDRPRHYAVNTLLALATLSLTLLYMLPLLPLPKSVKAKTQPSLTEQIKQAGAALESADTITYLERKYQPFACLTMANFPMIKADWTLNNTKQAMTVLAAENPTNASVQLAYALILKKAGSDKILAKQSQSKSKLFNRRIYPFLFDNQTPSEKDLEIANHIVENRLPKGWIKQEAKKLIYKASGKTAQANEIASQQESNSNRLFPWILSYSSITILATVIGAFVAFSALKNPAQLLAGKQTDDSPLTGRNVLSTALISSYTAAIISAIAGAASGFLPELLLKSAVTFASFASGLLAAIIASILLIARPAGKSLVDILNLRFSPPHFTNILKHAILGTFLCTFLFALVWIVQFAITGGIISQNPINWQMEALADGADFIALGLNIISIVLLAPIFEEILFRGLVYGWLRTKLSVIPAAFLSAFLFAAYHVDIQLLPSLCAMGFVMAITYERSKSLYASMLLHAIWNTWFVLCIECLH